MTFKRFLSSIVFPKNIVSCQTDMSKDHHPSLGKKIAGLPSYKFDQIAQHKAPASVWVTYGQGVYDVTEFVAKHPGGVAKIMMGAGGAIDPFWRLYGQHLHLAHVGHMLEGMRIGNIDESDWQDRQKTPETDSPYKVDLSIDRHPALIWVSRQPANAESPPALLADNFFTPNELFFVRHHFPVPSIEADPRLCIKTAAKEIEMNMAELKELPSHSVVATIQCTGNRRSGFHNVEGAPGQIKGLPWGIGAISTARWTGPRLRDVLLKYFAEDELKEYTHVHFQGRDNDGLGQFYGVSIPCSRAMDIRSDVLLALEMNDQPLPLDHGAPVRVVVPGAAGCRSVKWLDSITLSREESSAFWQKEDYKSFSPSQGWEGLDFDTAPAVMSTPVQSAITNVGFSDDKTYAIVEGYAFSGGGNRIIRVDVSPDGGKTWVTADFDSDDETFKYRETYAWVLWKAVIDLSSTGPFEFTVKAVDEAYNSQPETAKSIWNVRGILNNSWHTVKVE